MKYTKQIEMYFTGMIVANVERRDGTSAGLEFFRGFPFESEKSKMRRAHKWADDKITLLTEFET